MKALKWILIVVVAIVAVVFIVGLFLPGQVTMQRETVVDAPASVVYAQVNELRNWDNWSTWHQIDPNTQYTYSDPSAGQGAEYSWVSDHQNVGSGSLEITESIPNERIVTAMDFGDQGTAEAWFDFSEEQEGTRVVWGFSTEFGLNPIGRIFGLFLEDMLAPDYEEGLAQLKEVSEARAAELEAEQMAQEEPMESEPMPE